MRYRAPAKINLGLELIGRRDDGFHEIASVMLAVGLGDEVEVNHTDPGHARPRDSDSGFARTGLTDSALARLAAFSGGDEGFEARVAKKTPVAAGLGGGSSNAAIALAAANDMSSNPLPARDLATTAARVGSDVAFFLGGGCALVSGRGETIDRALPLPDVWIVLANLGVELSTPDVYREVDSSEYSDGERTARLADSIATGKPRWELMENGLQAAARRLCPQIDRTLELFLSHTEHCMLSGSGPTCFGLFEDQDAASAAQRALSDDGHWTWLGRPHRPWQISDLAIAQRSG